MLDDSRGEGAERIGGKYKAMLEGSRFPIQIDVVVVHTKVVTSEKVSIDFAFVIIVHRTKVSMCCPDAFSRRKLEAGVSEPRGRSCLRIFAFH